MFSWQARIKTLVTIAINTFLFISVSILLSFLNDSTLPTSIYLLTIIMVMLQQYIINKEFNIISGQFAAIIYTMVPFILSIIINTRFNLSEGTLLTYIFFLGSYFSGYFFENSNIDYEHYKHIYNLIMWILMIGSFFIAVIAMIFCKELPNALLPYYILFFLLMIISLRESRTFTFNMVNRESRRVNTVLSAVAAVVLLFITSEKTRILMSFLVGKLREVILWIILKLSMILTIPLQWFYEFLQKFRADNGNGMPGDSMGDFPNKPTTEGPNLNPLDLPIVKFIAIAILIVIAIVIVWQCVKIIRRMLISVSRENIGFIEEREVIVQVKKKKKLSKSILKKDSTVKERICHVFGKFQKLTKKKGVFEEYMTATQISNVSKIYVESTEELDIMSKIYNEAKFSNHTMTENELNTIKDSLNIINKEYKVK